MIWHLLPLPVRSNPHTRKWVIRARDDMRDRIKNMLAGSGVLSGFCVTAHSSVGSNAPSPLFVQIVFGVFVLCWLASILIVDSYHNRKGHPMTHAGWRGLYGAVYGALLIMPFVTIASWIIPEKFLLIAVLVPVGHCLWCIFGNAPVIKNEKRKKKKTETDLEAGTGNVATNVVDDSDESDYSDESEDDKARGKEYGKGGICCFYSDYKILKRSNSFGV